MQNRVLTTGEIAKYCGVNFRTVIRWIEKGYLSAYRLPGRGDNRIKLRDFIAFLQEYGMPIPDEFQALQRRILVVDDDLAMTKVIARGLERSSFEVQVAADGFQAGVILGTYLPAVMTLDLSMPGLDGFGVIEQVRGNERLQAVRILVVSGLAQSQLDRAIELGANAAMPKPFEVAALVDKVAELAGVDLEEGADPNHADSNDRLQAVGSS